MNFSALNVFKCDLFSNGFFFVEIESIKLSSRLFFARKGCEMDVWWIYRGCWERRGRFSILIKMVECFYIFEIYDALVEKGVFDPKCRNRFSCRGVF